MSDLWDQHGPGKSQESPGEIAGVRGILAPGTRVGTCRIERHLASGNLGSMYVAEDADHARQVAIKVLHPELVSFGEPFIRFLREARILDLVRHPNVVEIYDSGVMADGRAYLIMEYLEGEDLATHLRAEGRITPERAIAILEPVCDALTHAHARGVIHRGLKASNIFLERRPERRADGAGDGAPGGEAPQRIVLLDFVMAKLSERGGIEVTSSRVAIGSPASLAPEQIRGQAVDARSDVYGLGTVLYQMLTGRTPFDSESWAALQQMHLHAPRPRPSRYAPLSPRLDEVVTRAMSANPDDRYPSAAAFLEAVRAALSDAGPGPALPATAGADAGDAQADAEAPTPAHAVYVDVRVDPGRIADPAQAEPDDDAVLDAVDTVLEQAARAFADRGFQIALESSNAVLFVRAGSPEPQAAARERHETAAAAIELQRALATAVDAGPWLCVNVSLHSGTARFVDGRPVEGEVLEVERWAPDTLISGIVGTSQALSGIDAELELVDGDTSLLRLRGLAGAGGSAAGRSEPWSGAGKGMNDPRVMHLDMMAQIGRRTAGIVHDLRSPLTVIRGSLELVLDNLDEGQTFGPTERKVLENAYQCAQQMSEMVALILKASAIKSYMAGTRKALVVADLVDNALKLISKELRRKASISVRHNGECRVFGSPLQLTQVLINLIVNAAQAIPVKGRIELETHTTDDERVIIAVRDNGVGMTPDVQARIFEPYFSTKEVGEGSGLGLSLAHSIIQEHGGSIEMSSTPGEGSCFVIELPAASPDPSDAS